MLAMADTLIAINDVIIIIDALAVNLASRPFTLRARRRTGPIAGTGPAAMFPAGFGAIGSVRKVLQKERWEIGHGMRVIFDFTVSSRGDAHHDQG
jgi:hypothetical protein